MKYYKDHAPVYAGGNTDYISFPVGGLGAGMFCLEGCGALGGFSLRHRPALHNSPFMYAAVAVKTPDGVIARVLEGQVPKRKIFSDAEPDYRGRGFGLPEKTYGLPRFTHNEFTAQFPFSKVFLHDDSMPVSAEITGWSPFIPSDSYHSSLPCATLEYTLTNTDGKPLEAVFYFATENIMRTNRWSADGSSVYYSDHGIVLEQKSSSERPFDDGYMHVCTFEKDAEFIPWFRGQWFDPYTMLWRDISAAQHEARPFPADGEGNVPCAGATIAVPIRLSPGASKTISLNMCWYVPKSGLYAGREPTHKPYQEKYYEPWYASQFDSVLTLSRYYAGKTEQLRKRSKAFADALFASTLPDVMLEAVSANLSILKSPTILRQSDGRMWAWEGSGETLGSCHGTCTHVWNYAQAICHLFPDLERSLRQTEFFDSQNDEGHQNFRTLLPIGAVDHTSPAAADGQLGGILKVYREWHISGDTDWLRMIWGRVRQSLDYCINLWDTRREGILRQTHHNTYDIEFFGPEPMCTTIYLGALEAASRMAEAMGDSETAAGYAELGRRGRAYLDGRMFMNGYYRQEMNLDGVTAACITDQMSSEARELCEIEGPKYQYGSGCLSDGVIGAWMATLYGLGSVADCGHIQDHLLSVYRHNLKQNLILHVNTQRPGYALGGDGGLLLCTWPDGDKPSLPFVYSDEVWTGIEYQVASHLLLYGRSKEALDIVNVCRKRYDGTTRNPYDEYECGHWYARALSSFSLLRSATGVYYDKLNKTLYIDHARESDIQSLLCWDGGFALCGLRNGDAFVENIEGEMPIGKTVLPDR